MQKISLRSGTRSGLTLSKLRYLREAISYTDFDAIFETSHYAHSTWWHTHEYPPEIYSKSVPLCLMISQTAPLLWQEKPSNNNTDCPYLATYGARTFWIHKFIHLSPIQHFDWQQPNTFPGRLFSKLLSILPFGFPLKIKNKGSFVPSPGTETQAVSLRLLLTVERMENVLSSFLLTVDLGLASKNMVVSSMLTKMLCATFSYYLAKLNFINLTKNSLLIWDDH